jgi:peptide-methionine (S)-S-oxide reductase
MDERTAGTGERMKLTLMSTAPALIVGLSFLASCQGESDAPAPQNTSLNSKVDKMNLKQATFAGGCFWGTEAAFRKVPGVVSTEVGYTGGHTKNPTYREVCTHTTVSYPELLDAFWSAHDPTTVDRQGPDIGDSYRSAIFYHDAEQEAQAKASVKEVDASGVFRDPIVTQIVPASTFYPAEDYHQQYFEKEGTAESCHVGIAHVHTKLAAEARKERLAAATQPASPSTQPAEAKVDAR